MEEDLPAENSLRPRRLDEYIGQDRVKENLTVFIEAAKQRAEPLDHVLFHGYPGLGKTSLATVISNELGVNMRSTSGPVIERPGDLAAILTNLEPRDVLFIDEIHRLNHVVEEILYPAMEDFQLDIIIGQGPSARTIKLDLPPFTLVGATTRAGLALPSPARPFWREPPTGILRSQRPHRLLSSARPGSSVSRLTRRGPRDRQTLARNAADCQSTAEAGARLCRSPRRWPDHPRMWPTRP